MIWDGGLGESSSEVSSKYRVTQMCGERVQGKLLVPGACAG